MITHKIKQVQNADKIYAISDGKIKEHGSHEDLISNSDLYYLYNRV